ncbi:MAG: glycine cleavage system protein H [Verrucomicrobia bacterium RIFCSPLOWO2_12_FULL_64_8]|nr:MAG: glycine cleavage system protein H [Verrucomicrobia bacterium RIFCSPLOWO2_12_FULL_64_8]
MSNVPGNLRYAKSHEWVKLDADGAAVVGISDYAQASLGDITYVQLPKVGAVFAAGAVFGVVESVKAASDLYAPVGGRVTAVNSALASAPESINRSPYDQGWMVRLAPAESTEMQALLSAGEYAKLTG